MADPTFQDSSQSDAKKAVYAATFSYGEYGSHGSSHLQDFSERMASQGAEKTFENHGFYPTERSTQRGIDYSEVVFQGTDGNIWYKSTETDDETKLNVGVVSQTEDGLGRMVNMLLGADFQDLLPPDKNTL